MPGAAPRSTKHKEKTPVLEAPDLYGSLEAASTVDKRLAVAARWLEHSDDTDPVKFLARCCECDEFKARKVKAPLVAAWLAMQMLGALYQASLLNEITHHLELYEGTLFVHCPAVSSFANFHNLCIGPSWNQTFDGVMTFPPQNDDRSEFDFVIQSDASFSFTTRSQPTTFLLGVEPGAPHADATWRVDMHRSGTRSRWEGWDALPPQMGSGSQYKLIMETQDKGSSFDGKVVLRSAYRSSATVRIYVLDCVISHLKEVQAQPQCSFEGSWKNFNARQNGHHHRVLTVARRAVAFFLCVAVCSVGLVLYRFLYVVESGRLLSRIIVLKFFLQDFPQQFCIALYLYGWYASDGLRCQLCLFHPEHCDDEYPLHKQNALVCLFTLLSACANQMLIQANLNRPKLGKWTGTEDEDEECGMVCVRLSLFSVSTLPFSTALAILSNSLLQLHHLSLTIGVGFCALVGWGMVCCAPCMACGECDDENW
jgi:hypothetical protein